MEAKFDATGPKSREQLERIYREIAGVNPNFDANVRDEEQQRVLIAKVMQQLMAVTDPMVMMSMLVVCLGFMSDEHNVNRQHLADLLLEAKQRHAMEIVGNIAPKGLVP